MSKPLKIILIVLAVLVVLMLGYRLYMEHHKRTKGVKMEDLPPLAPPPPRTREELFAMCEQFYEIGGAEDYNQCLIDNNLL